MLLDVFDAMDLAKKDIYETDSQIPVFIWYVETRLYGWVFGWTSLDYIETGLEDYKLDGNVPLLVTKKGEIFGCNGGYIKEFLKEWEAEHGLGYLYPYDHNLESLYPRKEFPFLEGLIDSQALENAQKKYLNELDS